MSRRKKIYRNAGTSASPTWVEITEARDADIPFSPDKYEESDRGSIFKLYEAGQIELGINYNMTLRAGNVNCAHIRNSIFDDSTTEYLALFGDITESGSFGFRFFGKTFKGDHTQPLNDGDTITVEHAPTYHEEAGVQVTPTIYDVP